MISIPALISTNVRNNLGFEAISLSRDNKYIVTATESAVTGDPLNSIRLLEFTLGSTAPAPLTRAALYQVTSPNCHGCEAGLVSMLPLRGGPCACTFVGMKFFARFFELQEREIFRREGFLHWSVVLTL